MTKKIGIGFVYNNYELVGFRKSANRKKKYDAILQNIDTYKIKYVPFGADPKIYQHYRDNTPNKVYSRLNHNDKNRRRLYRIRHYKTHNKIFSPSWFSWHFLW